MIAVSKVPVSYRDVMCRTKQSEGSSHCELAESSSPQPLMHAHDGDFRLRSSLATWGDEAAALKRSSACKDKGL